MPETEVKAELVQEGNNSANDESLGEQNSLIECENSKHSEDDMKIDVEDAATHQKPGKFRYANSYDSCCIVMIYILALLLCSAWEVQVRHFRQT